MSALKDNRTSGKPNSISFGKFHFYHEQNRKLYLSPFGLTQWQTRNEFFHINHQDHQPRLMDIFVNIFCYLLARIYMFSKMDFSWMLDILNFILHVIVMSSFNTNLKLHFSKNCLKIPLKKREKEKQFIWGANIKRSRKPVETL